jgi:TRAP-type mannitol/chloroaromatic compound transport system permease small subunit
MKTISLILIILGFIISGICGLIIFYASFTAMSAVGTGASSAIGEVAWAMSTTYLVSFVNLFGFAILGLGVLLAVIGMFTGRKQQPQPV